jgi:AcrR family transcriptional regulator
MNASDVIAAKALLAGSNISVKEVAARMGMSISTLYKYIPKAS